MTQYISIVYDLFENYSDLIINISNIQFSHFYISQMKLTVFIFEINKTKGLIALKVEYIRWNKGWLRDTETGITQMSQNNFASGWKIL